MDREIKLVNLNVSNNSNLSFSLIKSEQLISFCKKNKIESVSICDYHAFDFINFYFLCKKNKVLPIWGIKKVLIYKNRSFFISFFPTSYSSYKLINSFFYDNGIEKSINFEAIIGNIELFLINSLFVFEARSFFDFEEACRVRESLTRYEMSDENLQFYIGINFVPKLKKIQIMINNGTPMLPFYSVRFFLNSDREYLAKFKSLDRKNLGDFKEEDFNQNYFHYLDYKELEVMINDSKFTEYLYSNLNSFISKIKISIRTSFRKDKESDFSEVKDSCYKKLANLNLQEKDKYKKLLNEELKVIRKKNYANYFNTISHITSIFRNSGVEVGPGRGSSSSSLVSYLIGITKIDPVKNDLYFWRFLNERRDDFPDIDVDVNNQEKSLEILIKKFGREHVSKISTRKTISLVHLISSSLGAFGLQDEEKSFILENLEIIPKFLKGTYPGSFKSLRMKAIFERNIFFFEFLSKFQDFIVGFSNHPSGVIIWEKKLPKILPINKSDDNVLVCSYPSSSLEKLGFKKFDFLSLTESLNFVSFLKGKFPQIPSYENISFYDFKTWELLKNSLVSNIFQLDSKVSRYNLLKISPSSLNDLTLLISLNRPGVDFSSSSIIKGKKTNYLDSKIFSKFINEVLSPTYGNILFEEQVSMIISFSMSMNIYEAELLRKKIKKSIHEKIFFDEFKENFFQKSSGKISFDDQNTIFKKIVGSAPYMFNKAHAVSYSYLTYYVSYLKSNYFEESINYFLEKSVSNSKKLFLLFSEVFLRGYEVVKPEINSSFYENVFVNKKFILGFSTLSKSDSNVFKKIIENRENFGKYLNLRDFIDRNIYIFAEYSFKNFLPWIETGLLRSLNYEASLIVENASFLFRYIKIKKAISAEKELLPFLDNYHFYPQKKSPEVLNEKELLSFNCYISYFSRWTRLNQNEKLEISSLQKFLKESTKGLKTVKTYSVVSNFRRVKNYFLLVLYDVNQVFEAFVSQREFNRYKEIIKINKEFVFELEIFSREFSELSIGVKRILEV